MIEAYTLESLLKKYGIDTNKVLNKNNNILEYGEYQDIDRTLNYLVNELHIKARNIEKSPSIMYYAVNNIKENYDFLVKTKINISNIETTLHILSTNPKDLKDTYNYILNNYGIEYINRTTSILSINIDRIKQIETFLKEKSLVISASISRLSIDEIRENIIVCQKYSIPVTGSVFKQTSEEIEKIVAICNKNNIQVTGNVFLKTSEEIEKIVAVCNKYNIPVTGNIFRQTSEEIEKIVAICNKYSIPVTGSVFLKTSEEIEKIVAICNKYSILVTGSVFLKTSKEIEKIVAICNKYSIPITSSVFYKSSEEIEKIIAICNKYSIPVIGSVFIKTSEEIEKIVAICNKYNITVTGGVFLKTSEEIEKSIEYIKNKYGEEYLVPLVINKNVKHLEVVLPYLESLGVLPTIIKSASILTLTLEEIKERQSYIESQGESLVLSNGRFNSVFGMSRANYKKLTKSKLSK